MKNENIESVRIRYNIPILDEVYNTNGVFNILIFGNNDKIENDYYYLPSSIVYMDGKNIKEVVENIKQSFKRMGFEWLFINKLNDNDLKEMSKRSKEITFEELKNFYKLSTNTP